MSTTNILVSKNYTVADHSKWYESRQKEQGLADNYTAMEQLMVSSAQQHVVDLSDVVIHRGNAENIREVFKKHFVEIYDLWKTGANILYADLDVLFLRPFDIFGKYNAFMMFNYTVPRRTKDTYYNLDIKHYFNCGVRYYPSTMNQACWDIGFDMVSRWNSDRWDTEQIIYNNMLWSQDVALGDVYKPSMVYQYVNDNNERNNIFNNNTKIEDATAVHFHGTRSSEKRLEKMRDIFNESN